MFQNVGKEGFYRDQTAQHLSLGTLFLWSKKCDAKFKSWAVVGDNVLVPAFINAYHFCLFELVFPLTISDTKHANTGTYSFELCICRSSHILSWTVHAFEHLLIFIYYNVNWPYVMQIS
jgi:hypothetical protein